MPVSFQIFDKILSPSEFSGFINVNEHFEGLKDGQNFVKSWLTYKQNIDQKTSGSTGKPTVHTISRKNIQASAQRTANALDLGRGLSALVCINMTYIGGKMMIARGMEFGWKLNIISPTSFSETRSIPVSSFDFVALVPLQIENLLKSTKGLQFLNSAGKIIVGGAPMGKHLAEQIQSLSCEVYATYGMTETVSHIALQKLNGADRANYFSMLQGVDYSLDERDCLRIRADVTNNQWIQTNDVVRMHAGRDFTIIGRADNVINSGGVKIQTEQLEAKIALILKNDLSSFAITSIPDELLGERVVLVCEGLEISAKEAMARLKSVLNKFELPKELITHEIPKTTSGKIDQVQLKKVIRSTFGK